MTEPEEDFIAKWRQRLASNPRFTQNKRMGGGITLPDARPITPAYDQDPELEPPLKMTPEEAKLIAKLEKSLDRTLSNREALRVLEQARTFGELWRQASAGKCSS